MSAEINDNLQAILTESRKLLVCLQTENDLLSAKQFAELTELAQEKQLLVDKLNQLDNQRASFSQNTEFSRFLKNIDPALSLLKLWQVIQSTIGECQRLNEVNGRLLQRQHQMARETMELLTGQQISQEKTYNAKGLTASHGSMITNVEA
jgi:flagella synthesis protein FlgN